VWERRLCKDSVKARKFDSGLLNIYSKQGHAEYEVGVLFVNLAEICLDTDVGISPLDLF
jgi:hypothetical protein